ncbi:MAG: acetyl-CoA carboxylase biotin carboxyl carrier protein subunit [Anaerolineae bacterium]
MKYFATINNRTYEIDIDHQGQVTVDGHKLSADMKLVGGHHLYSLLLDNVSYEVVLDTENEKRNFYTVMVSGLQYTVKVQDERSRRLALVDRSLRPPEGELLIKAPIPGLVVKVPVEVGQEVAEGETLVILEAMKMENELRAPRRGVVSDVRVAAGDQVGLGQMMLAIK